MANSKEGNGRVIFAMVGMAVLTTVCGGIADRYFAGSENDRREFAVAVAELRTTVGGLSTQVERLANQPYASQDDMRELRAEFAGLERRLSRIEGKLFPEPGSADHR